MKKKGVDVEKDQAKSSSPVMAQADFLQHLRKLQGIVVGLTETGQTISLRARIVEHLLWAKQSLRMSIMYFNTWKKSHEDTRTFDPLTGFSSGLGVSAVHRLEDGSDVKNDLLVLYKMLQDVMEEMNYWLCLNLLHRVQPVGDCRTQTVAQGNGPRTTHHDRKKSRHNRCEDRAAS